jgi:O-Antigen ligase
MRPATSPGSAVPAETAGVAPVSQLAGLLHDAAAPVLVAVLVGLVAVDQGGYFAGSWGWSALVALWFTVAALIFGVRTEAQALDVSYVAAFASLAAWTAASIAWSSSTTQSVLETQRIVLYVAALGAVVLLARRRSLTVLVAAIYTPIVAVAAYSLSTRMFPDRLGVFDPVATYRLSGPIGYWNGLGIFTVLGLMLGLGLVARARPLAVRLLAAAALPVLAPTLYLTFSRGSALALGVGLVSALLYDRRRLQLASALLLTAPAPAVATLVAGRSRGLTHSHEPLTVAVRDGHHLARSLLVLVPATIACVLVLILLERISFPLGLRIAFGAVLVAVPVAVLGVAVAKLGGPRHLAANVYRHFRAAPGDKLSSRDLNERFLSLASNGRVDLWRIAWKDVGAHPVLGSGAGTFASQWFRYRRAPTTAHDAHSLYLETLAELGPPGLILLVAALLVPFVAALRARGHPLAGPLLGAYVAFLLHAGADWDFELAGVGLAAFSCGAALVVAGRLQAPPRTVPAWPRGLLVGAALVLLAFAFVNTIGNSALAASGRAARNQDWSSAAAEARKAHRLMPWSSEPWAALGAAQLAGGDVRAAVASYQRAAAKEPANWLMWLDLAAASDGRLRRRAEARARRLNPLVDFARELPPRRSRR